MEYGPELDRATAGHCAVVIRVAGTDTVVLTGGAVRGGIMFNQTTSVTSFSWLAGEQQPLRLGLSPLLTPRSGHGCALLAGSLYVAGGVRGFREITDTVEVFRLEDGIKNSVLHDLFAPSDEIPGKWKQLSPLPSPRTGGSLLAKARSLFFIGGVNYKSRTEKGLRFSNEILQLAEEDGAWRQNGTTKETVAYHVSFTLDDFLCAQIKEEYTEFDDEDNLYDDYSGLIDLRVV